MFIDTILSSKSLKSIVISYWLLLKDKKQGLSVISVFFFQLKKADQRIIGEGSRIYAKLLGLTDDHGISV